MAAAPDRYELHYEDETHVETNPYLSRVWHRRGQQPTVPAVGTNRRLTVFGSVEAFGRGRVEVLQATQDSAAFARYLAALEARHAATGQGDLSWCWTTAPATPAASSRAALAERAAWLHVIWLAPLQPAAEPQGARVALPQARRPQPPRPDAARLRRRASVAGLDRLGGERRDIVDEVPDWFLDGHRRPPTGRPPGRPKGAKDSRPRAPYRRKNLPAPT